MTDETHPSPDADEPEVLDGLPVLGTAPPAPGPVPVTTRIADVVLASPARQVATLAAGGFVAGAATVALAHRRRTKSAVKRLHARRPGRPALGEIMTSNSFLVDVHLLRRD